MATTQVEIVVPDGLGPGDAFDVEWGGVNYNIAVPDGCAGGTALNIELPSLDQSAEPLPPAADAPSGMTAVEIVVPEGLGPGDAFDVEWGGVNYNIAVPDGCFGGTALNIELPSLDQPAAAEPPPSIAEEPCTKACQRQCRQCDGMKFKPEQKIEMMRSDGTMSPGCIVGKGWPGSFGPTYKVLLDEGGTKAAVTEDDIINQVTVYDTKKLAKAVPCTKQCTASCTQCDGLKFKPDQKVEVVRSDGAMSPGYIVGKGWEGFEGPTYKARRAALRRPAPSPATQQHSNTARLATHHRCSSTTACASRRCRRRRYRTRCV